VADQDLVYEKIKRAIQSGEFLPGHRLVESELSERFDAPRARVRSALFLLEHDGLIEHKRHRGATVRAIDQTEAREIIETRSALEGMAARRAAENATERDDIELTELVARMRDRLDAGSLTEASDVNMGIHQVVMRIADQQTITRLVASLNGNLVRYRYWTMFAADRPEPSFAEHKAIVDAILARNPDAAESAMRDHLANVWSTMHEQVIPDLPEI
jgi:DNA-binding GntR family transcriptional regulator